MPPPGSTPGAAPPRGPRERAPPGVVLCSAQPQLCEPGLGRTLETQGSRALFPPVLCLDPCCLAPHTPHVSPAPACIAPRAGVPKGLWEESWGDRRAPSPVSCLHGGRLSGPGARAGRQGAFPQAGGGYGSGAGGVGSLAPQEDPAGGQRGMRGDVPLGSAASAFHPLLDFSETPTPHGPTCLPKTWLLIPGQRLPGRPPPILWSPLGLSCLAGTQPARTGPGPHAAPPPTPVPRVCPPRPPPRTPVHTPPPAFSRAFTTAIFSSSVKILTLHENNVNATYIQSKF